MPFLVLAHDYPDALERRMATRQAHLDALAVLWERGKVLYVAALLNEAGDMAGSMIVFDFNTSAEVDAYLAAEPYIPARVWDKDRIEVIPCRPPPVSPAKP